MILLQIPKKPQKDWMRIANSFNEKKGLSPLHWS